MKKILLFLFLLTSTTSMLLAQNRTISGTVSGSDGNPLPGVSVMVQGASIGAATDLEGNYELSVPADAEMLVFSFLGFTTQEISIGAEDEIDVILKADLESLDQVLVVAYGTANKRTFTGAATTINAEQIEKTQVSNISRVLEGVSGVQITSGSGQPGAGSSVRIRGVNSLNASEAPLYVLDGAPYAGDINAINPLDIESITVLKDAASAALYGSRGANGVVIITTKSGKKGKPSFSFQSRVGFNGRGVPEYNVIKEPSKFYELAWEAIKNSVMNSEDPLSEAEAAQYASDNLVGMVGYNNYNVSDNELIDPATGKLNPGAQLLYHDDWEDESFESGVRQEYNGSVSGANKGTNYYFSLAYLNDKGYVIKSDFTRTNARLKVDQEINDWLKGGVNIAYANSQTNFTQEGATTYQNFFFFNRNIPPVYPVYQRDADGDFLYDEDGNKLYDYGTNPDFGQRTFGGTENPLSTLALDVYDTKADNISGRAYLSADFAKYFNLKVNYSRDAVSYGSTSWQNSKYGNAAGDVNGRGTRSIGRVNIENFNQLLTFNHSVNETHNIEVLLGHESYKLTNEEVTGSKENFLIPGNPELDNAVRIQSLSSGSNMHSIEGFFSQVRYDYAKKYLFSASFRRDASSRFSSENRWGTFWSVGAGYVISSEPFMNDISWLNDLKFKFSYGSRGNEGINNFYAYQDQYRINNNNGEIAVALTYKGNPNITWETKSDLDAGIDFLLFDKLNGSIDYFHSEIEDLLFNRPLPLSVGVASYPDNIGDMVTQGVEVSIDADVFRKKNFRWNINLNGTHYTNKITKLPTELREDGIVTGNQKLMEGHSKYDYYIREYAGVDPETGRALYYQDVLDDKGNPTGEQVTVETISDASRRYIGKSSIPDFSGGVGTTLEYKGFDFSIQSSYQLGGYVYDASYANLMAAGGGWNNWHTDIFNRWTPSNTATDIPIVEENYTDANGVSNRFIIDASYLNIKNIVLGYTLSQNTLSKLGFDNCRVFAVADNVWLWSKRKGLDPRQSFNGFITNAYSPIRTISLGVNLNF